MNQWFYLPVPYMKVETIYCIFLKFYIWVLSEIWLVCKYLMELLDKTIGIDDDDYREGRGEEGRREGEGVDGEGETSERKDRKRKDNK